MSDPATPPDPVLDHPDAAVWLDKLYNGDRTDALVFADWLGESDTSHYDPDREEYIRIAAELSFHPTCPATIHHPRFDMPDHGHKVYVVPPPVAEKKPCGTCPVCLWKARHAEILTKNKHWLSRPCPACKGTGFIEAVDPEQERDFECDTCGMSLDLLKYPLASNPTHSGKSRVDPMLDFYCGGLVPILMSVGCHFADAGTMNEDRSERSSRMMPREFGGMEVVWSGPVKVTYDASNWALWVKDECPTIKRFRIVDRSARQKRYEKNSGLEPWYWSQEEHRIPEPIFYAMAPGGPTEPEDGNWDLEGEDLEFKSAQHALNALGRATYLTVNAKNEKEKE